MVKKSKTKAKISEDQQDKAFDTQVTGAPRRPMSSLLKVLLSVVLLTLASILIAWFICWRFNLEDIETVNAFLEEKSNLFWYDVSVVFFVLALVAALTWRPFLTVGIGFSLASVLTYINEQKILTRDAPLVPEDFQMADTLGNLTEFIDIWGIVRLVCGVLLILLGTGLIDFYLRRIIGRRNLQNDKTK